MKDHNGGEKRILKKRSETGICISRKSKKNKGKEDKEKRKGKGGK